MSFQAHNAPSAPLSVDLPHCLSQQEQSNQSRLYLAGGAVGQARPVVGGQVEVGGAGAGVQLVRGQQAQVAAATVVQRAHVSGHCGQKRGGRSEPLISARFGVSALWRKKNCVPCSVFTVQCLGSKTHRGKLFLLPLSYSLLYAKMNYYCGCKFNTERMRVRKKTSFFFL